jgi:hypothetical protein
MSMMFFIIMLVVFLDRTAPASRHANPHCITAQCKQRLLTITATSLQPCLRFRYDGNKNTQNDWK